MGGKKSEGVSLTAGRDAIASSVVVGNGNRIETVVRASTGETSLAEAASLLESLGGLLAGLSTVDDLRIRRAIAEAQDELTKGAPRTEVVGSSVERALDMASKVGGFVSLTAKLRPIIHDLVQWLGNEWQRLQRFVP